MSSVIPLLCRLAEYMFAHGEPSPHELNAYRSQLPEEYQSLVDLLLNIRQTLRYQGFDVTHSAIQLHRAGSAEAVTIDVRVSEHSMMEILRQALLAGGFYDIGYAPEQLGGAGGNVTATASPQLLTRLRA